MQCSPVKTNLPQAPAFCFIDAGRSSLKADQRWGCCGYWRTFLLGWEIYKHLWAVSPPSRPCSLPLCILHRTFGSLPHTGREQPFSPSHSWVNRVGGLLSPVRAGTESASGYPLIPCSQGNSTKSLLVQFLRNKLISWGQICIYMPSQRHPSGFFHTTQ